MKFKQFIGIQIYTVYISSIELTAYFMYWPEKTRYVPISDVMSIDRYKKIKQFIHAADNLQKDNLLNKNNGLYKIATVITHVRVNVLKVTSATKLFFQ